FSRAEQWRIVVQIMLMALALGLGTSTAASAAADRAREAGLGFARQRPLSVARRFWPVILFVFVLLFFANTPNPWLVVLGAMAVSLLGSLARFLPSSLRNLGWLLMALSIIAGFQVVSGTTGRSWLAPAIVVVTAVWVSVRLEGLAGLSRFAAKAALAALAAAIVFAIYTFVPLRGIGWDQWSGLHLTLWVSALAIILSFPLGLLLALARRSTLPALRLLATGYIELIRGVPLITLLFMGQFILGFMLPAGTDPSSISRAIAAMTLFTAAYVAEIVRGGLQGLSYGQTEAAQALGLSPAKAMRLIILPQALRSVIPAMVGQFISIFKDSSLLFILAINEFLGVRSLVHAQADFRSVAHAETLVFVAFGYWAFAYAMSRESQRLERRLRVSST
ncbi:MAG TPA: amino acid ABC transporter permease, partial [Acidimicrobiia bacterium]|nr:amino acid ABC transporter permease [Acidimicrobiia bacterium]